MTTSLPEILNYSKNKTRVLLFTSQPSVSKLICEVLNFYGKEYDFFLQNRSSRIEENDFVIFETSELAHASQFHPNIVFISSEVDLQESISLLKNITPGGVLIYSSQFEEPIESSNNFFRKLPFSISVFKKENDQIILSTEMGSIPLSSTDEDLIKNLEGIKLLCQQFGVMEEEFYEPVMSFD